MYKPALAGLALGLTTLTLSAQDIKSMHGWIEDGTAKKPGTPSTAVRQAITAGAKYVFVDDVSKNVYVIDDPATVKGHEGHHVSINGGIDKVAMTVHVTTFSMLADQKPGPAAEAVGH